LKTFFLIFIILITFISQFSALIVPLHAETVAKEHGANDYSNLGIVNINSGIRVNSYPIGVAVNPLTNKIYVANELSNTVSMIDGSTDKVDAKINVGKSPYGITVNPLNNRIYVSNRDSGTVSVIDGSTNTQIANVSAGNRPVGVAVNPSNGLIYVTNFDSKAVSIIDGITNTFSGTIKVGNAPYGVAVDPLNNKTYVTNVLDNTISVIHGTKPTDNKVVKTIKVIGGISPAGIAINTSTNRVYVTNYHSGSLFIIDTSADKLVNSIKVGRYPVGVEVNPINDKIYVTNIGDNTVSVIDGKKNQIIRTITVNPILKPYFKDNDPLVNIPGPEFPLITSFVSIDLATNMVYVTNTASNTISKIDGNNDAVAVRLNFNINPPNSGDIECDGVKNFAGNSTLYIRGQIVQCIAHPNRAYSFDSWSGIVDNVSNPLTVRISEFGTLTASFVPTFPPETYLFIILGIVGSVPIFLGWLNRERQRRRLTRYLTRIETTHDRLFEGNKQDYVLQLQQISKEILDLFKRGKISDSYYNILDRKATDYISLAYRSERNT
jgi:YVTN family beta-propeller protein